MSTNPTFNYDQAFSRNFGWLTPEEQTKLRGKRIAIAGMGGVGGIHLLTLARLGIGAFNIADFDTFDTPNFNRQAGAMVSTLGQPKTDVLTRMAKDINPDLDINAFDEGVTPGNIDDFLKDVDLYVDGLDFFAFGARELVFPALAKRNIPAVIAAPLGMGVSLLNFMPGHMSFEEYFRWQGCSEEEKAIRFLIGLSPALLQRTYLMDPSSTNLKAQKVPSTPVGSELCAGVATTEAVKILLGRGNVVIAPKGVHFDAYRNKLVRTWRPWGNHNPLQRLAIAIAKRQLQIQ